MKKHLIIGNPIKHSLSPKIHNYWFKENNINAIYEKLAASSTEIKKIIQEVRDEKLFAMNVTVPFKESVIQYLDELSESAKKTNSVNTIMKKNGKIFGDNTDVVGFELAIKNLNINFKNKTALIIGAGGVVPSIIFALQNIGLKKIGVSNRTMEKIEIIKSRFQHIEKVEWGDLGDYDMYINATSVGLEKNDDLNLDISKLKSNKIFYDVIYNPPITNFLENAKKFGHKILNGETMFLFQAQKAFELWHKISPKIDNNLINFIRND